MPSERVWVIGASPDCDIVVDVPTVSGRHCRLVQDGRGYFLEDLGSTNGTYVNGRQITTSVPIRRTDVILMGSKVAMPWPENASTPRAPFVKAASPDLPTPRPALPESAVPVRVAPARLAPVPRPVPALSEQQREIPDRQKIRRSGASNSSSLTRVLAGGLCGIMLAVVIIVLGGIGTKGTDTKVEATIQDADGDRVVPRDGNEKRGRLGGGETGRKTDSSPSLRVSPAPTPAAERATSIADRSGNVEALVKPYEPAVVWIGFELRDFVFPHGTGWLVRADRVVTTAAVVADLEPLIKDGIEIVAWIDGRIVPVKTIHRHPSYDAENPGSQVSVHSNLGVAMLEEAVEPVCPVAPAAEISKLSQSQPLLAVGFESRLGKNEPFDELKVHLVRNNVELLKSELMASGSTRVYSLRVPTPKCCDGSPIFNDRGHVVGVLSVVSGEAKMVPVSQLAKLLREPAETK